MLADWGLSILAKKEYDRSIDEMKHADRLIQRVLFLGGLPNLSGPRQVDDLARTSPKSSPAISNPRTALAPGFESTPSPTAKRCAITVSRELFVHILENEEEHIDWLQTQLRLIEQMGIENFVQIQTKPNESGLGS